MFPLLPSTAPEKGGTMARRRRYTRTRRRSRRSYNLRKRVMPSKGRAPNATQVFGTTSGSANTTVLSSHELGNMPFDDDQDRKLLGVNGRLDFGLSLSGGQAMEVTTILMVVDDANGVPSVADYDPFQDQPGDSNWMGRPFKTMTRRYVARALPTGAPAAVIDVPIRLRSRRVVLLKPGQSAYLVIYTRSSAGSKNWAAAWDLSIPVIQ